MIGPALKLAGAALLTWGAYLLHPAAGYVVAGLVLLAVGQAWQDRRGKSGRNDPPTARRPAPEVLSVPFSRREEARERRA